MNYHYEDLRKLTPHPPLWFDEAAVPRYCEFSPSRISNIYADECALYEVACQGCGYVFVVGSSSSLATRAIQAVRTGVSLGELPDLAQLITDRELHYGDPPNIGCCPSGPTMNSVPLRVREYWRREHVGQSLVWVRKLDLEIAIRPNWADDEPIDEPWEDKP